MTKKRLTDLLREEAQKPATASPLTVDVVAAPVTSETNNETNATMAPPVATAPVTDVTADTEAATPELATVISSDSAIDAPSAPSNPKATAKTPEKNPRKITSDLEAELRQQITELKHTVNLNQTNIEILHSTITEKNQTLQRLKTELEETRKDNLRLAEANIQLKEELQALQQNPPQPQTPVIPVTTSSRPAYSNQIAPRQPELRRANATSSANQATSSSDQSHHNSSSLSRTSAHANERPPSRPPERPGIYGRPIGSNEENQRINNRNIGWMD